jgi:Xaa-Pro aminopeptidase
MDQHGIDALVLGKEANARYVTGARRLWLAGARAFAPGCVLVRETGATHLLSVTDDGVPADTPIDHLYPITWNPMNLFGALAAIPGLREARRIGVDALTPLMETLFTAAFPDAELVDGQRVMLDARARKLPAEIERIRTATALAARALDAIRDEVQPGRRERDLLGLFEQRMAEEGTTTPAFEATIGHRFPSDRALVAGEPVVLDVGVLVDGYEGGLARTVVCGRPGGSANAPSNAADELFAALMPAVVPGATGREIRTAWDATGAARPSQPVVVGVGLGTEPPIIAIGDDAGDDDGGGALGAGATVSLRAEVDGWVRRDVVVVTDDGGQVLVDASRP